MKRNQQETTQQLESLTDFSLSLGASLAAVIPSAQILVEERLAQFCVEPRCPTYGLSPSCPPYVSGPAGFRKLQESHPYAIVIRLDVLAGVLFGDDRPVVMQVMHEIVSEVEHEAARFGFANPQAFAGGSCKLVFCADEVNCAKLTTGECRHPDVARPSLSGFGVNVAKMMDACGWETKMGPPDPDAGNGTLSWVVGVVLVGSGGI